MRCAVVSRGLSLSEVERQCRQAGATNIRAMPAARQLFCDLEPEARERLSRVPGLAVKEAGKVKAQEVVAPAGLGFSLDSLFAPLRQSLAPPLTGEGLTVAVLDSGVRSSHRALQGKVVYEANLSPSAVAGDVFDHGTATASVAAQVSPGAALMNVKVLGDTGDGDAEDVVAGIDEVCRLAAQARERGLPPTDPLFPNVVNMSFGGPDDGDPDNPIRVAARAAVEDYGLDVVAAAGNGGPRLSSVVVPAVDPLVVAVGGILSDRFIIWEASGRGPTLEGATKPDFVFWATDLRVASAKADDAYVVKTGTSFSAPVASGVTGLLWEAGRRVLGPGWSITWADILGLGPLWGVKPAEAPVRKDNSYGYGLLSLGPLVGRLVAPAQTAGGLLGTVLPIFGLAMVGMMTTGMFRGIRAPS
jgi:serine protease AprX